MSMAATAFGSAVAGMMRTQDGPLANGSRGGDVFVDSETAKVHIFWGLFWDCTW